MDLAELESTLARKARAGGALRAGMGLAFETLARRGGHHELGFSSIEAYGLERCEWSARWVQEARALARRLSELVAVRGALFAGRIGFSMAQELARVASASDELAWLAEAETCTVRDMRVRIRERRAADGGADTDADNTDREAPVSERALGTLSVTVDREDAWLFEGARMIVRRIAGGSLEETIEALVGEGTTALLSEMDLERVPDFDDGGGSGLSAQRTWEAQLSAWRDEAERLCEKQISLGPVDAGGAEYDEWATRVTEMVDVHDVDAELRRLSAELTNRDVELGQLAETFWRADGWRRLGFATGTQYARERLGMSLSAVKEKRALGRRLALMPRLAAAVAEGDLGYEAARIVAAVATSETMESWTARAEERTVRHLREEVEAARMVGRLHGSAALVPPTEAMMDRVADIERRVVRGQMSALGELDALDGQSGASDSANPDGKTTQRGGRVTFKFRVGADLCRYYRWLERAFLTSRPGTRSFFGFLCAAVIDTWARASDEPVAYGHIYARDRYRCRSPVCGRRDVTPHHLVFRSRGGSDADANVASLCVWCHLEGVHGGRLAARPTPQEIHWAIGRTGHTLVRGRRRLRTSLELARGAPSR